MDDLGMTRSRQARAVIARVNPAKGMTFDASMCKYRAVPAVAALSDAAPASTASATLTIGAEWRSISTTFDRKSTV